MKPIVEAVLSRPEVRNHLAENPGEQERVKAYAGELATTQRYGLYRALRHPLRLMTRNMHRVVEGLEMVRSAVAAGRVIYASNHRSHLDYLIEPLVLEENGIRPPVIAAGINLFGGVLGLAHRHITGAMPVRRNIRDATYLVTLKAYVAELLRGHDLLFYPEGGRSYSGEIKSPKTGLFHAALVARESPVTIVPLAIAYDVVLEDHILAAQQTKRSQRAFSREFAEMMRYGLGYRTRVYVSFAAPIDTSDVKPGSRSDVLDLARRAMASAGARYKVLPTAIVASLVTPSMTRSELAGRAEDLIGQLRRRQANVDMQSGDEVAGAGLELLHQRGVLAVRDGGVRIRHRRVLSYYARSIEHVLKAH